MPIHQSAIHILTSDLICTFKLLGCPSVSQLNRSYIDAPENWTANAAGMVAPL